LSAAHRARHGQKTLHAMNKDSNKVRQYEAVIRNLTERDISYSLNFVFGSDIDEDDVFRTTLDSAEGGNAPGLDAGLHRVLARSDGLAGPSGLPTRRWNEWQPPSCLHAANVRDSRRFSTKEGSTMSTRSLAAAVTAALLLLTATAHAADKKVVRLWQTETEPQTLAVLNQIAAQYEKTHPDVSIKIEGLAWGDLEKKLTAALAAGAPPDAAHGQPITCVSFAAKGLLRPVEDLADSLGKDNIVDAFRALCRWQGRTYGVGHSPASSLFVYRKDLLAQKGLKVPKTWDELIQTAEALKESKDGQVVRYGLTMTGAPLFINIGIGELLKTNGGRLFDEQGRPTLTSKQVIELLDFYKKLNGVLPPGWTGHGYLDTFANLANGKAAMLYQAYGRGTGYIEKYAPKEIADPDHFAVADKMVGPSGKSPAAQLDCEPWMVFKDAKGGAEAVDFLKFFFKDENYIPYLHSVPIHLLSIKKSTTKSPKYADNAMIAKWRPWVDMQEKYFRNDWIKPVLVTDWDDMNKPYLLEVMGSGILVDMVFDSVKGMPSAEAAAKAQKRVEELLVQGGYLKK